MDFLPCSYKKNVNRYYPPPKSGSLHPVKEVCPLSLRLIPIQNLVVIVLIQDLHQRRGDLSDAPLLTL